MWGINLTCSLISETREYSKDICSFKLKEAATFTSIFVDADAKLIKKIPIINIMVGFFIFLHTPLQTYIFFLLHN